MEEQKNIFLNQPSHFIGVSGLNSTVHYLIKERDNYDKMNSIRQIKKRNKEIKKIMFEYIDFIRNNGDLLGIDLIYSDFGVKYNKIYYYYTENKSTFDLMEISYIYFFIKGIFSIRRGDIVFFKDFWNELIEYEDSRGKKMPANFDIVLKNSIQDFILEIESQDIKDILEN